LRGLDWFIFFLADVQTGFGPFVAVYLTTQKWTQGEIGLVLSIGGIIGLIGQMPGGAVVDAARSERLVAGLAVATIGISALSYAAWPIVPVVVAAATLHAAASCVLGPAIAAIWNATRGPDDNKSSVNVSFGGGVFSVKVVRSGLQTYAASIHLLAAALWIAVPPLAIWLLWALTSGRRERAVRA